MRLPRRRFLHLGTISHVTGELFKMTAGIEMLHVPCRGSAPIVTDLLSGEVNAAVDNLPASIQHIKAGKLRALAVTTTTRSPALPDIPTLNDFQPGFDASAWIAIGAPRNTPVEVINKLNKEINTGLADPKVIARIADLGATVFMGSPAELDKLVVEQTKRWGKVIRAANIKIE
jgi:tripartite-type tricarboxylate transporter receptor subunit TctC